MTISDDLDEVGRGRGASAVATWAPIEPTSSGARNGVPGELLMRLRPSRVVAERGIAD